MAQTHDTIDGLLAEFRGYAAGMPPSYHVTMSWHDFRRMLDRFDAANKRERGDCAKLREALEHVFILIDGRHLVLECKTTEEISGVQGKLAEARAALAAPPRNCDKFATKFDAKHEWEKVCKAGLTEQGPFEDWIFSLSTEQEGGNDADK